MSNWVRLWEDMPNDPKWRVIAKRAKRPIAEVLAVFVHMMTNAGQAANRGALEGWNDEDVGAALDMEPCDVAAIREAMQGKTLDGDKLSGWEKRQPKREDGGAERAKAWRENKKADRTQPNATERTETPREDTDTDTDAFSNEKAARAGEAEFRSQIAGCFTAAGRLPPDTGKAVVWLANGYKPEICIAVTREVLARKPGASLAYIEPAIRQAHEAPKPSTGPPAKPKPQSMLRYAVEKMRESNERHHDPSIIDVSSVAAEGGGWPDANGGRDRTGWSGGDYPGTSGPVARTAGVFR